MTEIKHKFNKNDREFYGSLTLYFHEKIFFWYKKLE